MASVNIHRCSLCSAEILGAHRAPDALQVCSICRLAAEEAIEALSERHGSLPREANGGSYCLQNPFQGLFVASRAAAAGKDGHGRSRA